MGKSRGDDSCGFGRGFGIVAWKGEDMLGRRGWICLRTDEDVDISRWGVSLGMDFLDFFFNIQRDVVVVFAVAIFTATKRWCEGLGRLNAPFSWAT
jgi:hypothetical protein